MAFLLLCFHTKKAAAATPVIEVKLLAEGLVLNSNYFHCLSSLITSLIILKINLFKS